MILCLSFNLLRTYNFGQIKISVIFNTKLKKNMGGKDVMKEEVNRVDRGWLLVSFGMQTKSGHAKKVYEYQWVDIIKLAVLLQESLS